MPGCSAPNCANSQAKGFALYQFPSDPEAAKVWAGNCRRKQLTTLPSGKTVLSDWKWTKHSKFCQVHFEDSQFEQHRKDGKKKLRPGAVPTLFEVTNPPKPVTIKRTSTYNKRHTTAATTQHEESSKGHDHVYNKRLKTDTQYNESEEQVSMTTIDTQRPKRNTVLSRYQLQVRNLKKQVATASAKLRAAQTKMSTMENNLKQIFNSDQMECLSSKKVTKWTESTIKKGFQLRFVCGPTGYNALRSQGMPFPSSRTLSERLQHVSFKPGIQGDIIEALQDKVAILNAFERKVVMLVDEMQLKSAIEYDKSLGEFIGKVTLPKLDKAATHALVVMIKGISSAWKQTVLWHLTGNSVPGHILHRQIVEVVTCLEGIGLHVVALVSDMGPSNQSLWKHMGISVTRQRCIHYIDHPVRTSSKLYVFADPQHVLKNIRNSLLKHEILLPGHAENVEENVSNIAEFVEVGTDGFATRVPGDSCSTIAIQSPLQGVVKMQYFRDIISLQSENDIILAPKLTNTHLYPDQHQKMNVKLAFQLLHEDTAATILTFIKLGYMTDEAVATAKFCRLIADWFRIMSSRNKKQSLARHWAADYAKKQQVLRQAINIFTTMSVGNRWMPIQTGLIMSTLSYLCLSEELFNEGFVYVLGGRFSQDAVENLFSLIRSRGDRFPSPLRFRANLRNISVSQYLAEVKTSSYMQDNDQYFVDLLKPRQKTTPLISSSDKQQQHSATPTEPSVSHIDLDDTSHELMVIDEQDLLVANAEHHLFGYVLRTLHQRVCTTCWNFCVAKDRSSATHSTTYFDELNRGGLIDPSDIIVKFLTAAETTVETYKCELDEMPNPITYLEDDFMKSAAEQFRYRFPTCCNLSAILIHRYYTVRMQQLGKFYSKSLSSRSLYK